jgi:hypothetical protein
MQKIKKGTCKTHEKLFSQKYVTETSTDLLML